MRHRLGAEIVQGQLAGIAAVPDAVLRRVAVDDQRRVDVHGQGYARLFLSRETESRAAAGEQRSPVVGGAGDNELPRLPAAARDGRRNPRRG